MRTKVSKRIAASYGTTPLRSVIDHSTSVDGLRLSSHSRDVTSGVVMLSAAME